MTAVICKRSDCTEILPPGRRRYCSDRCRRTAERRRERGSLLAIADAEPKALNEATLEADESADGRASMRRGPEYALFLDTNGPDKVNQGWTHAQIAAHYGVSRVTVTHWLAALRQDLKVQRKRAGWKPPKAAMEALADPLLFRDRYFRQPDGSKYITAQCHVDWMRLFAETIRTGGQVAIIAPPRYGKTEALIHECIRQIILNPNLRIMWIGVNQDRAEDAVGLAMLEMEHNERLIEDFCGPGGAFRPPARSGMTWTRGELIVGTRTHQNKSATMKAFGRGGRVIGFDADVIVTDDIEDQDAVATPATRHKTDRWLKTDVASRKMQHTARFDICSRQHPEDHVSGLQDNPQWRVEVYQAHSDDCTKPTRPFDAHVDCTLAPSLRSFEFLMEQRGTMGDELFEMNFLNRPRSDGLTIFPRDVVEDCRDFSRVLGEIPANTRLIVGLDPAHKGYQAAILWAVHVESNTRYLVDVENVRAGGVTHMRSILERWTKKYPRIEGWVIEQNIVEDTLAHDVPIRELQQRLGVRFIYHKTGRNKWDTQMGVPAMRHHFEDRRIVLPYGDEATRGLVEQYVNQLVNFTDRVNSHQSQWRTDLVMAGWTPEETIQGWCRGAMAEEMPDYRGAVSYGFRTMRYGR